MNNINNLGGSTYPRIMSFMLVGGLEVVGKVTGEDAKGYTVTSPMKQMIFPLPVPTATGMQVAMQSQFVPLRTLGSNANHTFLREHLMSAAPAPKALEDAYIEMTTSIKVAKPSSILT